MVASILISRRLLLGSSVAALTASIGLPTRAGLTGPAEVGHNVAREFLSRPQIMMYSVGDVTAVHYAEAAAAYGAAKLGGALGDTDLVAGVAGRHQRILKEAIPNTANHVDANVYGVWPLEIFRQTGDEACRDFGLALADGQWAQPRADGLTTQTRFWIDDVWMIGALQVQAWRATGNPVYLDRAGREVAAYVERLQQPNGLFFHGPEAPFHWGRGNGWVAAGLAEVLSDLPPDHPAYPVVRDGYLRMVAALMQHQAPDGMWRQLIDRPDSWPESSATAMFGFAIAAGVRKGLLKGKAYNDASRRAWSALTVRLQPDGLLSDICVGTGQSADAQYYLDRPKVTGDLHGQAPLLWFAHALLTA